MIFLGKKQSLKVVSEDQSGFYLVCKDNYEVFMPGSLATAKYKENELVEVFVYVDKEGHQLATPRLPKAEVGDFVFLEVKLVTPHGAFLDLGIPKDLLVPRKLQKYEMRVGQVHLVKILIEESSNRIFGSSLLSQFVDVRLINLKKRDEVMIRPYHKTPLGYNVLVEGKYLGLIFHNEIFEEIHIGKQYSGVVKSVREDGRVDVLFGEVGVKAIEQNSKKILKALECSSGRLNLCEKSSAADIERLLKMSKGSFKKALGLLLKQKQLILGNGYVEKTK